MASQKEAVFSAVSSVKGTTEFGSAVTLTKEERGAVSRALHTQFEAGEIEYDGEVPTGKKLTSYVSGLVSNWLRKDKRLNGNVAYVPRNPGVRAGAGDETLKAMRQLLAVTEDEAARAEIQGYITARQTELKPKKVIDFSAVPAELQHLIPQ